MYKNSSNPIAEAIPPYHACVSSIYLLNPIPEAPKQYTTVKTRMISMGEIV